MPLAHISTSHKHTSLRHPRSSRPRVDAVLAHHKLYLALHLAVVDAPTLLETDAVPLLVRLLVVAVAPRSVHHLLVPQYPVDAIEVAS